MPGVWSQPSLVSHKEKMEQAKKHGHQQEISGRYEPDEFLVFTQVCLKAEVVPPKYYEGQDSTQHAQTRGQRQGTVLLVKFREYGWIE